MWIENQTKRKVLFRIFIATEETEVESDVKSAADVMDGMIH